MDWPRRLTPRDLETGEYLRALTRVEELACFCGMRGHCLEDHGSLREAERCYARACQLMPCSSYLDNHLLSLRFKLGSVGLWHQDSLPAPRPFTTTPGVISEQAARLQETSP